jgi:tRNA threonylcarbamoyladenosine biosynthesis protein TsaE
MPILNDNSIEYLSHSPDQTRRIGMRLGAMLKEGDIIFLIGNLGAGKTTLAQGIASGWGSLDNVTSPSFVIVNVYRRPDGAHLYHMDAYRLQDAVEAEDLDIESYINSAPMLVEWAEKISTAFPQEHLSIKFHAIDEFQRDLMITAHGTRYRQILEKFRKQVFGVQL